MQREYGGAKLVNDGFAGTYAPFIMMTSTEGEGGMVYGAQFDNTSAKGALLQGLPGTTTKFDATLIQKRPPLMTGIMSRAIHKF